MEQNGKILDFIKRHSTWIVVALLALIFAVSVFNQQAETQAKIDDLILSIDAGTSGDQAYNEINKMDTENRLWTPLLVMFYVITGTMLAIGLSSIALYSYTNVPFTKIYFYGKNNNLDPPEREGFFKVASAIWKGVCFIIGCGIIYLAIKL